MIDKREVMNFSKELALAPNVVEKDYILGWLLAGIAHHSELSVCARISTHSKGHFLLYEA